MLRSSTFALTLLATGLASTIAHAQSTAGPRLLAPGEGVDLARIVFIDGDGTPNATAMGTLRVHPDQLAEATGMSRGYLHVVTDLGAVVYDAPIDANPLGSLPPALQRLGLRPSGEVAEVQVPFRLSSAKANRGIKAKVMFTPEPLFDARAFGDVVGPAPMTTWPLVKMYEAIGGGGTDKVLMPELPPIGDPGPPPPMGAFDQGDMPEWQYTLPHDSNVETAWNQCAEAAWANTLSYMEHTFGGQGIDFPQFNTKGVGIDGDETSLVSRMDWYMDRSHTDTCNGGGTGRCGGPGESSTMRGLFEFLRIFESDRRLAVSHQAGSAVYPGDCMEDEDRESQREGEDVTFDWLCDRVQDGAGIVMVYGFYSPVAVPNGYDENGFIQYAIEWDRTGGHVVRVIGCGEVGGQQFIRTLDDGQQDRMIDDEVDGPMCEERLGLRTQLWFVHENQTTDGRLELGDASRQIDFAMALTVAP